MERMYYKAAEERDALRAEVQRLRKALEEIKLRTSPYADDADWPLVSGVHAVTRTALAATTD